MHKILANTMFLGKDLFYLPECHSTNDVAREKLKENKAGEGSIIITDRQTNGRGQRGNQWHSEAGLNLTFSFILRPEFLHPAEQFGLNIAVSLGIREAISGYISGVMIKWPNDIVHEGGGKLGGILIENSLRGQNIESSIVGIGLNINQLKFPVPGASSIALLAGASVDKEAVLQAVIAKIEYFYLMLKSKGEKSLHDAYKSHLYRLGQLGQFHDGEDFIGTITGISDQGKLMIQKEDKELYEYAFKEVRFV